MSGPVLDAGTWAALAKYLHPKLREGGDQSIGCASAKRLPILQAIDRRGGYATAVGQVESGPAQKCARRSTSFRGDKHFAII